MKEKNKKIIFFSICFLFFIALSFSSAYAVNYLYAAKDVTYSNTGSDLDATNVQDAIDEIKTKAGNTKSIEDGIYSVGSIYMSTTDDSVDDVEERFGGTWEKIEGKFLVGVGSDYEVNSTGGSADEIVVSHNHTFTGSSTTTSSAGAHTHTTATYARNWHAQAQTASSSGAANANSEKENRTSSSAGAHTHTITASGSVSTNGESGTGKNMPPYYVLYIYKRTA